MFFVRATTHGTRRERGLEVFSTVKAVNLGLLRFYGRTTMRTGFSFC